MKVKNNKEKKLNPFELHINSKKFTILGRKSKNEVGKPGISRSKSIQKRKKTLLLEYKIKDKSNKFVDRRIGEKNRAMTADDRVIARFTASRVKAQKKMKYNLGEEEDLTHHGHSLSTIEKFEKPMSDDDDDSDDDRNGGKLGAEFVEKAHFGGGVLSRSGDGESSHRDLIDKLIAESKLRKYEKKQLKQETNELTEQLDKDWKELMPVVPTKNQGEMDNEIEPPMKTKIDKNSYDVLMRTLKFDRRGMASDKLKSEVEIAKQEKERLEKLENDRLKRMKGNEDDSVVKHRSADDLDDGFYFDDDEVLPLAYDSEGKPLNCSDLMAANEDSDDITCEENENEDDVEMESDDENNEDSENENLNYDMSDLKEDDDNSDNETNKIKEKDNKNKLTKLFTQKLKNKKVIMDEARKQLPYTFIVPESYEEFQKVLEDKSIVEQILIIDRMIKVNHPSLGNNNSSNLQRLYPYLLQHINDHSCSIDGWKILNLLAPHLYDITQFFPDHVAQCFIEVLKEKHSDFVESTPKKLTSDMLIFLKLIPLLFPSSDYHHPVCTLAVMIGIEILSQTKIKNRSDISSCLLLTTILLEYVELSKRYIPEAVNILRGMLLMATDNSLVMQNCYVQQFKPSMKMLVINNNTTQIDDWSTKLNICEIFSEKDIDDSFKLTSLYVTLDLICRFCKLYADIPSIKEIWSPHLSILNTFTFNSEKMNIQIEKTNTELQIINKKLVKLQTLSTKPKVLRLYDPKIKKIYDGRTFKTESKEKAERSKLLHRYKREMKSAVREIRKDNSFLSKLKYHEQVKSDVERRNKVKQIYSWGANQAHEINKLEKKKKK